MERAGGNIDPGQGTVVPKCDIGGQIIMPPGVEQRFLGQCAGGDKADDIAAHHGLGSAFLGLARVFHLFADRYTKSFANKRQQIVFGGMNGDTTHGNVLAQMFAAFGQGNIQSLGRGDGIVKEHLVKITHAIKQQGVFIVLLDLKELRHHRRDGRFCAHFAPRIAVATLQIVPLRGKTKAQKVETGVRAV